jgi:hypothetical protein
MENNNYLDEPHPDDQTRQESPIQITRAKLQPEDVRVHLQMVSGIVCERTTLCSGSAENVETPENASHDKNEEVSNSEGFCFSSVKAVLDRSCEKSPMAKPVKSQDDCCNDKQPDFPEESLFGRNVAKATENKNPILLANNSDPNMAKLANIFDSHCHVDRIYNYWNHRKVGYPIENLSRKFPEVFGSKFEGCIAVNCDPRLWRVRIFKLTCFLPTF